MGNPRLARQAASSSFPMARKPRFSPGGLAYHVMNRTWPGVDLFEDDPDYQAF
jgi:hypothetical protein